MRLTSFFLLTAIPAVSLFAQDVGSAAVGLNPGDAQFTHQAWPSPVSVTTGVPAMQNLFVIAGTIVPSGLPCFNCVTGVTTSAGIAFPSGTLTPGGAYAIDNLYIDNGFTGNCNFTLAILNSANKPLVAFTFKIAVTAGSTGFLATGYTIPATAPPGTGHVYSSIKCGTNPAAVSASPIYIQ